MANDCPQVHEFFLDDTNSCCIFEDLDKWAEGFRLVDMYDHEDSMTDGQDDTTNEFDETDVLLL
jgi:hypothetical protein